MTGVLAALGAAMAWTTASSLWRSLSGVGSAVQLNCLKNGLATLLFAPLLLVLPWTTQFAGLLLLILSGAVGIAAGDSFYLAALRRLGTRRTLTVEAVGPVLASVGSVLLMGEQIGIQAWIGALLVSGAVVLIARPGQASDQLSKSGLLCALMAVLCGLTGAFMARLVLNSGDVSPLHSAVVRLLGGWLMLMPIAASTIRRIRPKVRSISCRVLLATALGTNLGIALQQVVFQQLPVGPGVTLMSTAPVMALVAARFEGEPIQWRGVVAALLAVCGVALTSLWS